MGERRVDEMLLEDLEVLLQASGLDTADGWTVASGDLMYRLAPSGPQRALGHASWIVGPGSATFGHATRSLQALLQMAVLVEQMVRDSKE